MGVVGFYYFSNHFQTIRGEGATPPFLLTAIY